MEPSLSNSFAQATPSRAITKGHIFCTLRSLNTHYYFNRPNNQIGRPQKWISYII